MQHRRKTLAQRRPHALAGRVGPHPLGVLRLEREQLLPPGVVLGIGYFGRVEHVVQVGMVAQQFPQGVQALAARIGTGGGFWVGFRSWGVHGQRLSHRSGSEQALP